MTTNFRVRPVNRIIITSDTKPTPDECKMLRQLGFDFDKRGVYWFYEAEIEPVPVPSDQMQAVLARLMKA
jgi:hypothetical protein